MNSSANIARVIELSNGMDKTCSTYGRDEKQK